MSKSINYNVKKRGGTWVLEDSRGTQIETSSDPQALQTLRQKLYREARALALVKDGDGGPVATGGDQTISTKTGLTAYDLEGQKKHKTPRARKTLSDPEGVLSPDEMAGIAEAMGKNWEGPDAAELIAGQDDTLRKTDKFKRCVAHVIDSGKSEDAAYAICTSVLGPHGKGKESQKMRVVSDLRKFAPPGALTTIARYAPFDMTKRDDEQQIVIGLATSERIDGQDEIVDPAAFKAAIPDFMEWANLREMHENKAAGQVLSVEPIDGEIEVDGRKIKNPVKIVVKVLDKSAWEKVKAGVYKGFSIGGKVVDWINETINGQAVRRITDMILTEISLVDRPANEDARILMFKRATDDMPDTVEIEWDQLGDGQYNYMDALTKTRSEIRPIPGGKFSVLIAKYDGAPVASFLADDLDHATLQAAHNLTVMRWRAGLAKTQAATEPLTKADKTLDAWDEMPSGELRAAVDVADPDGDRTVYAIVYKNVNGKWVGGVYYDAKGDKAIRESAGYKERGEARDWVEEWVRTEKIARPAIKKVSVADFKPGASVTFTDAGEARSFFAALEKDANGGTELVDRPILNDVLDDFEKLGEGTLRVERGRQAAIITVANDDDSDGERIKVWLPESMMAYKLGKAADFPTAAKQFVNSNPAGLPSEAHAPLLAPARLVEDFANQKQDLAESRDAKGLATAQRGYTRDYRDAVAEARDALNKIVADEAVPAETRQAALALLAIKADRATMRKYDIAQGDDVRHYVSLSGYKVSRTDMRNLQGEFERQKRANPGARIEINIRGFGREGAEITLDVDGKTVKTAKGFQGSEIAYAAKPAMRKDELGGITSYDGQTDRPARRLPTFLSGTLKFRVMNDNGGWIEMSGNALDGSAGPRLTVSRYMAAYITGLPEDSDLTALRDKLASIARGRVGEYNLVEAMGSEVYTESQARQLRDDAMRREARYARAARPTMRKARRLTIRKAAQTYEFGRWQVDDAERMATSMGIVDAPRIRDFIKTLQETQDRTATLALVVDEDAGYADATLTVGSSRKDARVTLGIREKTMSTSKKPRTAIRKASADTLDRDVKCDNCNKVIPAGERVYRPLGDLNACSRQCNATLIERNSFGNKFRPDKERAGQKSARPSVRKAAFPAGLVDGLNATIDRAIDGEGGYITAAMHPDYIAADILGDQFDVKGLPEGDEVGNYYTEDQLTKMVLKACEAKADADAAAAVSEYPSYKKSGSGLGTELHWHTKIGYADFSIGVSYDDDAWKADLSFNYDSPNYEEERFDTLVEAAKWGYDQAEKYQDSLSEQGLETADVSENAIYAAVENAVNALSDNPDGNDIEADIEEALDHVRNNLEFYGGETEQRIREEIRRELEARFDYEAAAKPRFTKSVAGPKRVTRIAKADVPEVGDTVRVKFKKPHGMTQGAKFVIESIDGGTVEFRGYGRKFDTSEIEMTPVEKSARPTTRKSSRPAMRKKMSSDDLTNTVFDVAGGDSSFWDEELGDQSTFGWYALVVGNIEGTDPSYKAYILHSDDQGFDDVSAFESEADARKEWKSIEADYEEFEAGDDSGGDYEGAAKPRMKKARRPVTATLRTRRDPTVDALKRQVSKLNATLAETAERLENIERQPANVPSPFVRPNPGIGKVLPGQGSTFQKPADDPRDLINKRFAELVELRRVAATEPNPMRKAELNRQILIEEARLAQGGN